MQTHAPGIASHPSASTRNGTLSRRRFLRRAAATALAAPFLAPSLARAASANSKLNHASIGVGGMGWNDLQQFQQHPRVQITAVCDVDATSLKKAAELCPGARAYADWRELLEKEGDRIDSVNITVPDHSHFAIAWSAIEKGKHVYVQKPMCHDVAEIAPSPRRPRSGASSLNSARRWPPGPLTAPPSRC